MEEIATVIDNVPEIADDQLVAIADDAEKRIGAVLKIKAIVLKLTNFHDWVDQNGKPYLQASGAEKVARVFGISWRIDEPIQDQLEGGHFSYTYKGYFTLRGTTIEAIGTRSSKDGFFKRYGKDKAELPASEIDRGDVKKAAFTNLIGNGITRLLGIRNLTYDELRAAGIDVNKITKVDYGTSKQERTGKITDAQRKRFYAKAKASGYSDEDIKDYMLKTLNVTTSNDIPAAKYDEACKWADTKRTRQPGEDEE